MLWERGVTDNKMLVDHLLKTELTKLAEAMEGTVAQSIVDPENPKTALSVRAMLTAHLGALEVLPDTGTPFSIRDWIAREDRGGDGADDSGSFLFLTSRGDQHASLRGLISTWIEIAVNSLLSLDQADGRRIWIVLDELPTLHQVPSLQPGLAESRQFGGCFVLGIQVVSSLRDLYGRNGAETISGLCGSHAIREEINAIVRERLVRDGIVHGPAVTAERLVSKGYTNAEKSLAANYAVGDVVAFHRPYKRLGVEKGDELRVAGVDHKARTVELTGADGRSIAWEPERIAARTGGVEVYRGEDMELRTGDRIRWTRNDAGLGLVNSQTAEVAAVKSGAVTFRLEDGRRLDLSPGDPQLRHIDRAWASTVHAFQGRTVDTVIAAMEAKHPNLTTQQMLYVEISRARDRAELVTDDRAGLREQLEAVTGERIAALEAVGPEDEKAKATMPETAGEAGRGIDREGEAVREQERPTEPEMEQARGPKGVERDMGM